MRPLAFSHALYRQPGFMSVTKRLMQDHNIGRVDARIIDLVTQGLSRKEVCRSMGLTEGRVNATIRRLLPVLGVRTTLELRAKLGDW